MADVEWILHVDNIDALAKIKQAQAAMAELNKDITGKGEERVKLLQQESKDLQALAEKQRKTYDTDQLDQYNRTVGEGTEVLEEQGEAVDEVEKKQKKMSATMAGISGIALLVVGALKGLVAILKSTGSGADKLKVAMAGVKGAFEQFTRSIATGRLKNLIKDMKEAADEARRYQRALIDIANSQRILTIGESKLKKQIEDQQAIIDSSVSSIEERDNAFHKLYKLEKELNDFRQTQLQKTYDNEIQRLIQITKLTEEQVRGYVEGDEAILQRVAKGQEYNNLLEEEKRLRKDLLTYGKEGLEMFDSQKEKYDQAKKDLAEVNQKIADFEASDKSLANFIRSIGIPMREQWNEVTAVYLDLLDAQNAKTPAVDSAIASVNQNLAENYKNWVEDQKAIDKVNKSLDELIAYLETPIIPFAVGDTTTIDQAIKGLEKLNKEYGSLRDEPDVLPQHVIDAALKTQKQIDKDKVESEKQATRDRIEIQKYYWEATETLASGTINAIYNLQMRKYQQEMDALDLKLQQDLDAFEGNEEMQKIIYERYMQERDRIDKQYAKKERDLAIIEATIRGALAIVQAWAQEKSWQMALARSVAAAAVTATEIASISSQPLAKGGSGDDSGMVTGKRHSEGGERFLDHIEVESGEAWGVLSRKATAKYGRDFHEIVSSFNRGEMPTVAPLVNTSVLVNNDGSNTRLDKVIAEQQKLNSKFTESAQVSIIKGKKYIVKGNSTRIIG